MKKLSLCVLTLLFIIPFSVFALSYPKVLTLTAEAEGNTINYSGTTEDDSHAVMCKLYNSQDEEIDKLSVAVNNSEFEGSFTTTNTGDYKVACANYEGGEIKTTSVSVEEESPSDPPEEEPVPFIVTFDSKGGSEIESAHVFDGERVSKPTPDPVKDDKVFGGWFEDDTYTREFDFNTPITGNITLFALWEDFESFEDDDSTKDTTYTVEDEHENTISFKEEAGHTYHFEMIDYLAFTKEEVMASANITSEEYDQIFGGVKEQAEKKGTFLFFFDINVYELVTPDENNPEDEGRRDIHDGPFTIKIKMTEELAKYNDFKMYYVDENFQLAGEAVNFEVSEDGNYLVGTLNHLSPYVLVGNVTSEGANNGNPKTGDYLYVWIGMLMISIVGLAVGFYSAVNIKKSKK